MSKVAKVNSKTTDEQMLSSIGTYASETVPTTKPSVNETKQEYEPRDSGHQSSTRNTPGPDIYASGFEPTSRKLDSRISLRRFAKYW